MSTSTDAVRSRLLFARAFVEGTQDGTGSFGALARASLEGLHPGDGMWAGALGMTSVPMQLFAPLDVLPQLEEAEAQLQGISGTDAEGDRAMLGFFLGSTLMNARRFEEGTASPGAVRGQVGRRRADEHRPHLVGGRRGDRTRPARSSRCGAAHLGPGRGAHRVDGLGRRVGLRHGPRPSVHGSDRGRPRAAEHVRRQAGLRRTVTYCEHDRRRLRRLGGEGRPAWAGAGAVLAADCDATGFLNGRDVRGAGPPGRLG